MPSVASKPAVTKKDATWSFKQAHGCLSESVMIHTSIFNSIQLIPIITFLFYYGVKGVLGTWNNIQNKSKCKSKQDTHVSCLYWSSDELETLHYNFTNAAKEGRSIENARANLQLMQTWMLEDKLKELGLGCRSFQLKSPLVSRSSNNSAPIKELACRSKGAHVLCNC